MNILGISAFYHDSAACLVKNGEIIAAAQEERFSRVKHDHSWPRQAIQYCLREGMVFNSDLDFIAFYDQPYLKFKRLVQTCFSNAPGCFDLYMAAMPMWLKKKLWIKRSIKKEIPGFKGEFVFPEHHESHAASAFYPSPFDKAAILTIDGVGEWTTGSCGVGNGSEINLMYETRFPHSLGMLYTAFTYYCGFKPNSGEYKLMGLAPYGEPHYMGHIMKHLIDVKPDGSFRLNMEHFNYCRGLTMTNSSFHNLFGGEPRDPESPISDRIMDIAASIQAVIEHVILLQANFTCLVTKCKNLCLAGGVALNCVANGKILRESYCENIWIQPAAGDAGGALGAALYTWHQKLGNPKITNLKDSQKGSLLGPSYPNFGITNRLDRRSAVYHQHEEDEIIQKIADAIADGKVVGHMDGRMEFGPRALGSRSIFGDARSPKMQSIMNLKIKFRESFRPFAPCVLQEDVAEYFDVDEGYKSPYMLLVSSVRHRRFPESDREGLDIVHDVRSPIPAITHVDHSARVQTVDQRHLRLHKILTAFKEKTGCSVLINTSFNIRGEPIVCNPEDAYRCFMGTNMDVLVIGNVILYKEEQPDSEEYEYISHYGLD